MYTCEDTHAHHTLLVSRCRRRCRTINANDFLCELMYCFIIYSAVSDCTFGRAPSSMFAQNIERNNYRANMSPVIISGLDIYAEWIGSMKSK